MAQFGRPSSDVTVTSFTGLLVDTSGNRYQNIDESSASDADYNYGANNTAAVYECGLSSLIDPNASTGHIIRYRIAKTNAGIVFGGGNALTITVELFQGTTLIASDSARTPTGTWTTYSLTLSASQADSITNYGNLRLRFTTSASGGSPANRRGGAVSWAEMEVPDVSVTINQPFSAAESLSFGGSGASSEPFTSSETKNATGEAQNISEIFTSSDLQTVIGENAVNETFASSEMTNSESEVSTSDNFASSEAQEAIGDQPSLDETFTYSESNSAESESQEIIVDDNFSLSEMLFFEGFFDKEEEFSVSDGNLLFEVDLFYDDGWTALENSAFEANTNKSESISYDENLICQTDISTNDEFSAPEVVNTIGLTSISITFSDAENTQSESAFDFNDVFFYTDTGNHNYTPTLDIHSPSGIFANSLNKSKNNLKINTKIIKVSSNSGLNQVKINRGY